MLQDIFTQNKVVITNFSLLFVRYQLIDVTLSTVWFLKCHFRAFVCILKKKKPYISAFLFGLHTGIFCLEYFERVCHVPFK